MMVSFTISHFFFFEKITLFFVLGVAVRSNMDATITNQYSAVIARLSDQVKLNFTKKFLPFFLFSWKIVFLFSG